MKKSYCFGYSSKLCRIVFSTLKMSSYHFFSALNFKQQYLKFLLRFYMTPTCWIFNNLVLAKKRWQKYTRYHFSDLRSSMFYRKAHCFWRFVQYRITKTLKPLVACMIYKWKHCISFVLPQKVSDEKCYDRSIMLATLKHEFSILLFIKCSAEIYLSSLFPIGTGTCGKDLVVYILVGIIPIK